MEETDLKSDTSPQQAVCWTGAQGKTGISEEEITPGISEGPHRGSENGEDEVTEERPGWTCML
jgi:hypothetical protein